MTEILSEAEIEFLGKLTLKDGYLKKSLNTIKLQRQQLAEQERKVWNEAIRAAVKYVEIKEISEIEFGIDEHSILKLLKPESEVSGE